MSKLVFYLAAVILVIFTTVSAAETTASEPSKPQTHCPVMGGKIDSTVYTDIQGQRVYHCCPGCQSKLIADPDKYFMKAYEAGIVFENIQTACPVTGKPVDKNIVLNYQGRRVYFADAAARTTFEKDPKKYLEILTQQAKSQSEKKSDEKKHESGHSH